jgi:hypothetical protein
MARLGSLSEPLAARMGRSVWGRRLLHLCAYAYVPGFMSHLPFRASLKRGSPPFAPISGPSEKTFGEKDPFFSGLDIAQL